MTHWDAEATLSVGGDQIGPYQLDTDAPVTVGRSVHAGMRSDNPHLPRELATIRWTRDGWILENDRLIVKGRTSPMRLRGEFIATREGALFAPRARVLLQRSFWTAEWDLGERITLTIAPMSPESKGRRLARNKPLGHPGYGTLMPAPLRLTETQTIRMAALFAPLIRGEQQSRTPQYAAAAPLAGCDANQLKSTHMNVLRKVNARRDPDARIRDFLELGYYLIDVEGVLGAHDLRDSAAYRRRER